MSAASASAVAAAASSVNHTLRATSVPPPSNPPLFAAQVHQKIIIRQPHAFLFHSHRGAEVDVKRLPKRPAPPRFGRSLTESQKAS
ncbi:hypothetical protein B296_00021394 [Ensete ventricosum]|uniref:Uncharacterized protein n=1 Tax=Ensete ventricosum TaxID=4639 RepID=A0A427A3F2_ENSVE|nr:hypothetical protein B296_00021394 [Ensete ventricosum]